MNDEVWEKRVNDLTMDEMVEEVIILSNEFTPLGRQQFAYFKRRLLERIAEQEGKLRKLEQSVDQAIFEGFGILSGLSRIKTGIVEVQRL